MNRGSPLLAPGAAAEQGSHPPRTDAQAFWAARARPDLGCGSAI